MTSLDKKNERRRFWRNLFIQIILILLVYFAVQAWQARDTPRGPAPPIQGVLLDGRPVNLADYRGEPLLLHFWASWCSICRFEQDSIDAIAEDYPVLSVASQSGDAGAVQAYVTEHGLTAPVLVDEDGELGRMYAVRGFPSSYVIDAQGRIFDVEVGYSSEWGLRARLLLAGY
ncbi:protein disulfide oxidoreductase [Sulfuriflexus sp.]|uniref:protein disulfide oxidoreductase n=1 Tax=Sulfuriflexus sp. TaxID=2015443 RepID=UPI0028CE2435|nr:protein disulfide oxidoreductase [Sulfuriflexus sp.]MDT8404317.1 protein disulfide oxidoreductase [Sulfuriflexus sp.]